MEWYLNPLTLSSATWIAKRSYRFVSIVLVCVCTCERVKGGTIGRGGEEREREREREEERGNNFELHKQQSQLLLQVRGRSNFSTVGEWSNPEILTLQLVPPPANITVALADIKRDNELQVSFDVLLNWEVPEEFVDKFPRFRRQTSSGSTTSDDPTGYEVLITTEDDVGVDYAVTPTGVRTFNRIFSVRLLLHCACACYLKVTIFAGHDNV